MTQENKKQQITSPVGTIVRMTLDKQRPNFNKTRDQYDVKMVFDGRTTEGKQFKQQLTQVAPKNVVTSTNSKYYQIPEGHFAVGAWSSFLPKITDSNGNKVEEVPTFSTGSSGKGVMVVTPYQGQNGSGLNLNAVVISDLELAPYEKKESQTDKSIQEALAKINKG